MIEVIKLQKHIIYYFFDDKIRYYINVPYKDFDDTNICLDIVQDASLYDLKVSDKEVVKKNIIDYYQKIDNDNITLVLPVLDEDEEKMLLSLNNNELNIIEKLMSLYINSSYLILKKKDIVVNNDVYLLENDKYIDFINYFKNKHNNRILVKKLIEIKDIDFDDDYLINDNNKVENKVNNINYVKPFSINENIINDALVSELNNEKDDEQNIVENIELNKNINSIIEDNVNDNIALMIDNNNSIDDKQNVDDKLEDLAIEINPDLSEEKKEIINEKNNKEEDKKIEKKESNVQNNVINVNDVSDLAAVGLNGKLPGNVTINIERLVTENKVDNKEDNVADEVSDLDDDITDIDELDDNEDFDIDAIDVSEAVLSSDDGNKKYRTVISGGVKFVVGKKGDENINTNEPKKSLNNLDSNNQIINIDVPTNILSGDDQINKNAGFASYFTLFFVGISAIFLIVYIIIK